MAARERDIVVLPSGQGKRLPALLRRLRHDRRGAAAIEFALTCTALLVFLVGVMESARAIWTYNALQFAVEQAGRYVIANPKASDSEIEGYVAQQLPAVDPGRVTVQVLRDTAAGVDFVTIVTSYSFMPVSGLSETGVIGLTSRSRVPLAS